MVARQLLIRVDALHGKGLRYRWSAHKKSRAPGRSARLYHLADHYFFVYWTRVKSSAIAATSSMDIITLNTARDPSSKVSSTQ